MSFRFDVISLFPELFEAFSKSGLVGQSIQNKLLSLEIWNPRHVTSNVHKTVDDRPFGGGDGMVMKADVMSAILKKAQEKAPGSVSVYMTPQGEKLTDSLVQKLSLEPGLILICGRYGGIDERFIAESVDMEVSIGDYVLNGGEVAAMAVVEAVSRQIPGVLGNQESVSQDSFRNHRLEAPQFTRPAEWGNLEVPKVLTSGDHAKIKEWRQLIGLIRTAERRPDLLELHPPIADEVTRAKTLLSNMTPEEQLACGLDPRRLRW